MRRACGMPGGSHGANGRAQREYPRARLRVDYMVTLCLPYADYPAVKVTSTISLRSVVLVTFTENGRGDNSAV